MYAMERFLGSLGPFLFKFSTRISIYPTIIRVCCWEDFYSFIFLKVWDMLD